MIQFLHSYLIVYNFLVGGIMDRQELLNINKNRKMEVESYHSDFDFDKSAV